MINHLERFASLWALLAATFISFGAEPVRKAAPPVSPPSRTPANKAVRPPAVAPGSATNSLATPARSVVLAKPASTAAKPVLLYSRYYNAEGESRYLPDGSYKTILTFLTNDFAVRVHNKPLSKETLADVKVLMIANPSDKAVGKGAPPPHVAAGDLIAVTEWVLDGGGLIVMGNQEDHNLEIKDLNRLLKQFGMQLTNLYTDAKLLVLPPRGLLGGLRWAYYTGNLVTLMPSHPADPHPLIQNDLAQKPASGTRDQTGVLAAISTPGTGRVVVVTDAGWISNAALSGEGIGSVAFKEHDNLKIFQTMLRWLGKHGETSNNIPPPGLPPTN